MSQTKPVASFRPDRVAWPEGTTSEEMARDIKHMANEAEGLCPNGCGPIIHDDGVERHCPVCGFIGFTHILYVGPNP